jgi:malate dehydrogenase (oxaloacetate-decarboxylating)(NADP+)
MDASFKKKSLEFHETGRPGKIEVVATKNVDSMKAMSLAYSPGVGAACEAIKANAAESYRYTAKGNLIGVISNGTAVLGYGNIGPHAAKPVMEGKGILFKRFADIDVFDIEIDEENPERIVEVIASFSPTFGGLNLEDIKAPECFEIERRLRKRLGIPVFHDDQHGTAVVVAAAVFNAVRLTGRTMGELRIVCNGAGAAAIASLNMLVAQGVAKNNIWMFDSKGLIEGTRQDLNPEKQRFAQEGNLSLEQALRRADVFLGVSTANVLSSSEIAGMAQRPLIMALANPIPEIMPGEVLACRPDAIVCTGRSDFPNQVNNVLCFPYVFRGALDVRAKEINSEMLSAAARAIADIAYSNSSLINPNGVSLSDNLIPGAFDPRLLPEVASAVAYAAIDSGVAQLNIGDRSGYERGLRMLSQRLSKLTDRNASKSMRDIKISDRGEMPAQAIG